MPSRIQPPQRASFRIQSRPLNLCFCHSCSLWRISCPTAPAPQKAALPRQLTYRQSRRQHTNASPPGNGYTSVDPSLTSNDYYPHLSSRTAINAPIDVPSFYRPLYDALERLKNTAGNYVNLSRLQLALRGLERGNTRMRIAVLGIGAEGGLARARRLVRLLLADPLVEKEWEKRIEGKGPRDERDLLVRYGEETEIPPYDQLLETLPVPSQLLERHNIEILVSTLNVETSALGIPVDAQEAKEAILVPSLQTPISSTGRISLVTYPIHSALLVGKGLEDAVAWGRYSGTFAQSTDGNGSVSEKPEGTTGSIKVAFDVPGATTAQQLDPQGQIEVRSEPAIVDINEGVQALAKFRESIANSVAYEHGWLRSNLEDLQGWIIRSAPTIENPGTSSPEKLHPALRKLIASLLTDARTRLNLSEVTYLQSLVASVLPEEKRAELRTHLATWSEAAHRELQASLERAFASREWRKLRWYKLFLRVDDVQATASNLLMQHWLPLAQDESYLLLGRLLEAGLLQEEDLLVYDPATQIEAPAENVDGAETVSPQLQSIHQTRTALLNESTPALQAQAQTHVLNALGTLSLTTAFSALTYVWSLGPTLEAAAPGFFSGTWAGAIFSGGLVFALVRLQGRWEKAMVAWEGRVREEGRTAIKGLEDRIAWRIAEGGRGGGEESEEGREKRRAREGLDICWERLEEVER
ncbi:hypothetical protein EV356DRAFT_499098 [Viridothelium virens]|uniref:Mmc1 C-terminal domain-containing protein n=1 Tax=Viridothelium virens TaxID=1048519 RepID=A0A6A6HDC9_VIRVR|nr:hypothetical protein EV356DRAFT_499098 [Viridothelium virens]